MPFRNFLSRLAGVAFCVVVGYLLAIYFQFTINFNYETLVQTPSSANHRQITLSVQPYHEMKPMDLFGPAEVKP